MFSELDESTRLPKGVFLWTGKVSTWHYANCPNHATALELKGCLVYGWAVSKKLPTSFLICCSKAFYDGALLDNACVGNWVIRFVWWRSLMRSAWRVEWNSRSSSACPCHNPSSAGAWSAAKGPYRFWSSFFRRQSRGPCQRWSLPLARANIGIFLAMKVQSSLISMKEQASVFVELARSAWAACTNQRETVLWWMLRTRPMAHIPIPSR